MTKKTGKSKGRGKSQRHANFGASAPKMPLQLVLNHRAIDSMALEFIHWQATEHPDPADAFECLELVKLFLTAQHAINGSSSATAIDSATVDNAVGAIAASLDPDEMDEAASNIYFALHSYIHFLKSTGRWSGTEAAYNELHSILGSGVASAAPILPEIQIPDLSNEEQDAAFRGIPLIQRASSLLAWLGAGKEVTSTGALRLKDIEPAAAAVGIRASGRRSAPRYVPPIDLEAAGTNPETPLEVGTMFDVPVLRDIWAALVAAGLIRLGSTRAVPGPEATAWNSTNIEERLNIRRLFSVAILVGVLTDADQVWDQEAVTGTLLAVLACGTTHDPMPVAELERMTLLGREGAFLQELDAGGTDAGDTDAGDRDLADRDLEEMYAAFAAMEAQRKLSLLVELGLVEAETDYRVPPVVIQCVELAMGFLTLADDPSDGTDPASNVVPIRSSKGAPNHR